MAKNTSNIMDKVCQFGQTCYCNPSFGDKLSKIFITMSIILLIITIFAYLVYLNRHKISSVLSPSLCKNNESNLNNNNKNNGNLRLGSQ